MPKSNLKLINYSRMNEYEKRKKQLADELENELMLAAQEQRGIQELFDPLNIYIQKIESLADFLDCSEDDAERIILNRVSVMRRKTLTLHK